MGDHEKYYMYEGKEIPLFLSETLTVQDPQGFVKYAFDAKRCPTLAIATFTSACKAHWTTSRVEHMFSRPNGWTQTSSHGTLYSRQRTKVSQRSSPSEEDLMLLPCSVVFGIGLDYGQAGESDLGCNMEINLRIMENYGYEVERV